jgi:hypothetical protein
MRPGLGESRLQIMAQDPSGSDLAKNFQQKREPGVDPRLLQLKPEGGRSAGDGDRARSSPLGSGTKINIGVGRYEWFPFHLIAALRGLAPIAHAPLQQSRLNAGCRGEDRHDGIGPVTTIRPGNVRLAPPIVNGNRRMRSVSLFRGRPRSSRQDQLNDSNAERADSDGIGSLEASHPDAPTSERL